MMSVVENNNSEPGNLAKLCATFPRPEVSVATALSASATAEDPVVAAYAQLSRMISSVWEGAYSAIKSRGNLGIDMYSPSTGLGYLARQVYNSIEHELEHSLSKFVLSDTGKQMAESLEGPRGYFSAAERRGQATMSSSAIMAGIATAGEFIPAPIKHIPGLYYKMFGQQIDKASLLSIFSSNKTLLHQVASIPVSYFHFFSQAIAQDYFVMSPRTEHYPYMLTQNHNGKLLLAFDSALVDDVYQRTAYSKQKDGNLDRMTAYGCPVLYSKTSRHENVSSEMFRTYLDIFASLLPDDPDVIFSGTPVPLPRLSLKKESA